MAVSAQIELEGADELQKMLDGLLVRELQNLNRAAVHAVASQIAKDARQAAPKDSGRLRKQIKARRRRAEDPNKPASDVYVAGPGFYWRFLEYGTTKRPARPFFQPAIALARGQIKQLYREMVAKKLSEKLKRDAKRRQK